MGAFLKKAKVSKYDVLDLCKELNIVSFSSEDTFEMEDELALAMESEGNTDFLQRYTEALLNAVQFGVSQLGSGERWFRGFGKRKGNCVTMIVKTEGLGEE